MFYLWGPRISLLMIFRRRPILWFLSCRRLLLLILSLRFDHGRTRADNKDCGTYALPTTCFSSCLLSFQRPRRKPRRSSDDPEGAVKVAAAKPTQKPKQVKAVKTKKATKGKQQAPAKPAVEYHSSSEDEGEGVAKEEKVEVAAAVAEGVAAAPGATAVAGPSRRKQLRRKKGKVFLEDKVSGAECGGRCVVVLGLGSPRHAAHARARARAPYIAMTDTTPVQAGLLNLLDNVTASKDAVIAEKKEKEKARVAAAAKRDVSKKPSKRAVDHVKALVSGAGKPDGGADSSERLAIVICSMLTIPQEAAKKSIVAKDMEKRRRRKGKPAAEGDGAPEKKERKKVGFA